MTTLCADNGGPLGVDPRANDPETVDRAAFGRFAGRQFVGYSLVGAFVFVLGVSSLVVLVSGLHLNPVVAGLLSTSLSLETNFLLNEYANWADRPGTHLRHWRRFHGARIGTVAFNQLLFSAIVVLGVHYLVAITFTTGLMVVVNYFVNDAVVFR